MKRIFLLLALSLGLMTAAQAQISAAASQIADDANPDAKYLVPIPVDEDGKVYLERVLTLPEGTDKDETFAKMKNWLDRCMKDERIISSSPMETDQPYTVSQMVQQEMVLASGLLALDKTEIYYGLNLSLKDNNLVLKLSHISYRYNGDNPDRKMLRHSAEDYIADKVALNKRGDKMVRVFRRFRVKTIDLIDEYETSLKLAFLIK